MRANQYTHKKNTDTTPVCDFHLGSAGRAYCGVLLVVPARDEAVLSLHLLHPVFIDLLGSEDHNATVFFIEGDMNFTHGRLD